MTMNFSKVFNGIPKEFIDILKYIRNLEFEEIPNYVKIKSTFEQILAN